MLLDIRADHLKLVQDILADWVPEYEVWAFGSRAKWTAKDHSDLDLCIITQQPLPFGVMGHMQKAFSDSDLPYKVDLLDWSIVSAGFRQAIQCDKVVVRRAETAAIKGQGMGSEWKAVSLGECVELDTGFAFKSSGYTDSAEAVRLLRGDNIGQGQLRWDGARKWLRQVGDTLADFELRENDLVLAMDRPWIAAGLKFARVRKGDLPALLVQRVARLRPKAGVDEDYLHSVVASPDFTEHIQRITTGTAVPHISGKQIKEFKFKLPDFGTQQALGKLLISLDNRITLLRETNATLEAIAQALFKSWFVDFDPARAKMEGRAPEGMDEATAALFPDGFEESTLGLVPRGWRVTPLSDAFEINPKHTLKKGALSPYLDMASLATSGHSTEAPIQREAGSGAKFRNGDSLLARITPCLENGKSAFVDFLKEGETGWGSTEFVVLRPKAPLPEYFGYLLCRHPAFREYAVQSMSGTSGRQRIQNDVLGKYLLALPGNELTLIFAEIIEPIQKGIAANHQTAQTLATLRDTLLPRLISGVLRLDEAKSDNTNKP